MGIAGWFALIAQFYLIIENRTASVTETIIRYFSFYTILTNILVSISTTVLLIGKPGGIYNFFTKPATQTAILVYITIVGVVYNVILRSLWQPTGMQKMVDEVLHTIVPLLYIIFWIAWTDKRSLKWKNIPVWLLYPAAYAIYTLIRGAIVQFYPYPFMNVTELGYGQVLINSAMLVLVFLLFSAVPVMIGRLKK